MKLIYPEYMDGFKCSASACCDNCCIGWEIDIDEVTLERYRSLTLGDGTPIIEQTEGEGTRHFKLCEDGRCFFLDKNNLCKIISCHGEECVPEICREHPRYYSAFPDLTEAGLGLCCEEACRLILTAPLPIRFKVRDDGEDGRGEDADEILTLCRKYRKDLFDMIFDKRTSVSMMTELMLSTCVGIEAICFGIKTGAEPTEDELAELDDDVEMSDALGKFLDTLEGLEALDKEWSENIKKARKALQDEPHCPEELMRGGRDGHIRRLLFYFLHRYLLEGVPDLTIAARVRLSVYSSLTVLLLSYIEEDESLEALCLAAKSFSKNVEYSTDNVDALIDALM